MIDKTLSDKCLTDYLPDRLKHNSFIEKCDQTGLLKYKWEFVVSDRLKADNFRLKLINDKLNIEIDKRVETENFREVENFRREITVPAFVDTQTLTCFLETYENDKNLLIVEAYLRPDCNAVQNGSSLRDKIRQLHKNNGFLNYKFDLSDYDPQNISISVRNKSVLVVNAFKKIYDSNGKPIIQEFNHELNLPEKVEFHNIRNCLDESDGVLRIEIPVPDKDLANNNEYLKKKKISSDAGDKYLELMFDLLEFKFDGINVYKNSSNKRVLEVRAVKDLNKPYVRKYILPDWVKSENLKILQEQKYVDDKCANLFKCFVFFIHKYFL
ncbi:heat shock beta-11-like [Brachionus plicatilis]|uniref:Heat shock beta-11-like n=1 Tax=Brachionus plicatilis TaxID=10195 RepID=A0A3M7SXL3_BRAPC|nr:heat shock beta-11-like [Brachionus plicatilis]